ncbi:MAG TPA: hypothetical protein VK835_10180 [Bacteroidia bacterium]|jgi:hypothetical protein|nr:hypothetical protein [Bacteroidia bacterium]
MKKFYSFIFIALLGVLIFQGSSCKGPQPCHATITVVDSVGSHPQAGVAVHLYANVVYNGANYTGDLVLNGTTDVAGQVSFTIKNPAILNIHATVTNCDSANSSHPKNKYCNGVGIVRFDEGLTNTKTVYLNQ